MATSITLDRMDPRNAAKTSESIQELLDIQAARTHEVTELFLEKLAQGELKVSTKSRNPNNPTPNPETIRNGIWRLEELLLGYDDEALSDRLGPITERMASVLCNDPEGRYEYVPTASEIEHARDQCLYDIQQMVELLVNPEASYYYSQQKLDLAKLEDVWSVRLYLMETLYGVSDVGKLPRITEYDHHKDDLARQVAEMWIQCETCYS